MIRLTLALFSLGFFMGCATPYKKPCRITGVTIELDEDLANAAKCNGFYDDNNLPILPPRYARGCQRGKTLLISDHVSNWSHEVKHLLEAYCR